MNTIYSIEDLVKLASLEVLLNEIKVSKEDGTFVFPIKCPAVGRTKDYGKTEDGRPACVNKNDNCRYFGGASFTLDDFVKKIICNFS